MSSPLEHLSGNGHLGKFFIDGLWVPPRGSATAVVLNPATEEPLCEIPLGNGDDVASAVAAARRAIVGWKRTEPAHRADLLGRLQATLEARHEILAHCLTLEMGAAIGYQRFQFFAGVLHFCIECEPEGGAFTLAAFQAYISLHLFY